MNMGMWKSDLKTVINEKKNVNNSQCYEETQFQSKKLNEVL